MSNKSEALINPPVENLLDQVGGSNFRLVALAASRGRQINNYHGQLGKGIGSMVPPQVSSTSRKSLSIAFEEIAAGKIVPAEDTEPALDEDAEILKALLGEDAPAPHEDETA